MVLLLNDKQTMQVFLYRYDAAGSLLDGGWLVTGGSDKDDKVLSSVVKFANNQWQEHSSMPNGVRGHCQVTVGGNVFVIGGESDQRAVSSVYKLIGDSWTEISSIKIARTGHMCSVLNGVIYVMGGIGDGEYLTSVETLPCGSDDWKEGPPLPGPVTLGQSVVNGNTVLVMGGYISSGLNEGNANIYRSLGYGRG